VSEDPKYGRCCDQCGRAVDAIKKIHLGNDYCAACYQRVFVRKTCSRCGETVRHHRHAAGEVICGTCERSTRTCLRCGKPTPQAGKIVGRSAVCNACSPYFKEKAACACCGRESSRLSRAQSVGLNNPVCHSCRNKVTHGSCSICRRYRAIVGRTSEDRPYCRNCVPDAQMSHPCPDCGDILPGSGLGRCQTCLVKKRIRHDAALAGAKIEADWVRCLWESFAERQIAQASSSLLFVARTIRSVEFFLELQGKFVGSKEITSKYMSERFGSKFLRKYLVASRFVIERLNLERFQEAREDVAERGRALAIVERASEKLYGPLLHSYAAHLEGHGSNLRTMRLYLRAAEAFCVDRNIKNSAAWPSGTLEAYLIKSPGHFASLTRFVTFCRKHLKWDVAMPRKGDRPVKPLQAVQDRTELRRQMKKVADVPPSCQTTRQLGRILALSLGVPAVQLVKDRKEHVPHRQPDGSIYMMDDAIIAKDSPLFRYAQRWVELSERHRPRR
jgi:hypothetical protein